GAGVSDAGLTTRPQMACDTADPADSWHPADGGVLFSAVPGRGVVRTRCACRSRPGALTGRGPLLDATHGGGAEAAGRCNWCHAVVRPSPPAPFPASTTGRPWPGRRQGTARRTPAASLGRGRISCVPLALLGEDQLVVAGVAQAVHAVAVADQDLALPAQQLVAAEGLHLDRGRGGGRGAA